MTAVNYIKKEKFFCVSLVLILLIKILSFGRDSLFLKAEMWAEMATNYYFHSQHTPFLTGLLVPDSGYLPLFLRLTSYLIAWISVPADLIPFAYQLFSFSLISVCLACFSLTIYRPLMFSDLNRLIVGLLLAFHFDYELHTFINAPYYLILPMFYFLFLLIKNADLPLSTWSSHLLIIVLGILSKPAFLSYSACLIALSLYKILKKKKINFLFWALPTTAAAFQAAFIFTHKDALQIPQQSYSVPWSLLSYPFMIVYQSVFGKIASANYQNIGFWIILALIPYLIFKKRHLLDRNLLRLVAIGWLGTLLGSIINLKSLSILYGLQFPQLPSSEYLGNRHWFVPVTLAFLALLLAINEGLKNKNKMRWVLVVIAFSSEIFQVKNLNWKEPGFPTTGSSNWSQYVHQINSESACIPVNPLGWFYLVECEVLNEVDRSRLTSQILWRPSAGRLTLPPYRKGHVRQIAVLLDIAPNVSVPISILDLNGKLLKTEEIKSVSANDKLHLLDILDETEPRFLEMPADINIGLTSSEPYILVLGKPNLEKAN